MPQSPTATSKPLSRPIVLTIAAVLVAIPLQPLLGLDWIYDVGAVLFVGSKWFRYLQAGRMTAEAMHPTPASPPANAPKSDGFIGGITILVCYALGLQARKAQDWDGALRWFSRAAAEGSAGAMNWVGAMHMNGEGRPADLPLAAQWFEKAIAHGDREHAPENLDQVATAYLIGKRIPQNLPEFVRLSEVAAHAGYAESQQWLGRMYREGWGVSSKDRTRARHWLTLAAAQGNAEAKAQLDGMDGEDRAGQGGGRDQQDGPPPRSGRMTRAEALEVLELEEGATKQEMRAAYMRLMQQVHPDKGGSNYFAKQLNEAREVLGF